MRRCTLFLFLAVVLLASAAADVRADISNAAVLYLRIAPGARAAGMGEAYVAIADDATATHWNPAGLGAYPLASSWVESEVPGDFRPLKGMAALKTGGSSDYLGYEVWGITAKGLARFDNKSWSLNETFTTRTDQTVEGIVSSFFNVSDAERLSEMVQRVADANNKRSFAYLDSLAQQIRGVVPPDYSARQSLSDMLDSLLAAYPACRINWDRVVEVERYLTEGYQDSTLSEIELDRINIAVERSRNRFIAEELVIPYAINYSGEPNCIAAHETHLLIGTDHGLLTYDGKRWFTLTAIDGLPSDTVLSLFPIGEAAYVGTTAGLARVVGERLGEIPADDDLPAGRVGAVAASGSNDVWAAIDNDLYHYNGTYWANFMDHEVVLDETAESIAERFAVYGTPLEREKYLEKLDAVQSIQLSRAGVVDMMSAVSSRPDTALGVVTDTSAIDSLGAAVAETVPDSSAAPAGEAVEATAPAVDSAAPVAPKPLDLTPGNVVRVPFLADIKGEVTSMFCYQGNKVWIGTSYGLLYYDGSRWSMPGYRSYRMKEGETFDDIMVAKHHDDTEAAQAYSDLVNDVNDLEHTPLTVGREVKIYRNPAAAPIRQICRSGDKLLVATEAGLLEYDGDYWGRAYIRGMDRTSMVDAATVKNEIWLAGEDRIVTKANGRSEFTFMHVKWLPELTDDVYYEYLAFVSPSENWGTFGGSITFITYGTFTRTNESGLEIGEFDSFDLALSMSYGTALSSSLKVGLSAKVLYSKLADQGAGLEKGSGSATGFALDFGMLYLMSSRLTWGLAITNIGPKMAYIDASQADDLPRNLAFGFAYKLIMGSSYDLLVTAEMNKIMVGLDDGLSEELKQTILNGGAELTLIDMLALRGGYIYDQEGDVKTATVGVGFNLFDRLKIDFSYIPSNSSESLKNTMRVSLSVRP